MSAANTSAAPMAPDPPPVLLVALARSRDARIEIKLVTWQGRERVDIREMYFAEGTWKPTAKGAGIRLHELDQVIAALVAVKDGAR